MLALFNTVTKRVAVLKIPSCHLLTRRQAPPIQDDVVVDGQSTPRLGHNIITATTPIVNIQASKVLTLTSHNAFDIPALYKSDYCYYYYNCQPL